ADACQDWGADNVLPGGATLSLNIKKSNRQEIAVTTYQCIVEGSGKLHVENTGGSFGTLTRENAVAAHNAYVATVQAALEATNVQQYVEENPGKDNAFGGIMVYPEANISSLSNTQDGKASSENKYYFRDDGTESPSNEGDLDVNCQGTDTTTYTFYTCTKGDVHMKINNTSPKACADDGAYSNAGNMINLRTLVREKLEKAVERNQGSDAEAIQGTAPNWYSEAFDGVVRQIR
ncbi:MAG: hypothetical protein J6A45_02315, partial [Lachnospiraceae bacterium]|nr:hypothetical protein [Lachnospiraceae bacterium]